MMSILKREEEATLALRQLYRQYGYLPYKMSRFEEYDLYVRNKDFLVSDQIITFSGPNGKLLALKPDVTLSIIKNSQDTPGAVQKLYYDEHVYRADGAGRSIREILQTGLECVGDLSQYQIGEVVLLAARSLELLGGDFILDISHMGLIAAVMDSCGVTADTRQEVLRCLRQKNTHDLLAACPDGAGKLAQLTDTSGNARQILNKLDGQFTAPAEQLAIQELKQLLDILELSGFGDNVRIDFSVGNDMKYYSGVVFKGYVSGIPASILSGGQYDKLLRKMGRSSRAIGFALYLDLLNHLDENNVGMDVDTLILHDPDADLTQLTKISQAAADWGTVLVCTAIPKDRGWGKLIDLRGGKCHG